MSADVDADELEEALRHFDARLAETEEATDGLADATTKISKEQLERRDLAQQVDRNREAIELLQGIANRLTDLVSDDLAETERQVDALQDADGADEEEHSMGDEHVRGYQ